MLKGAAKTFGKGGAAVQDPAKLQEEKRKEKMKAMDPSLKVWIGNLSAATTWSTLSKHFQEVAKPKLGNIMKKGTAVLAFATEDDVANVIGSLNGSEVDGQEIEVDVWTTPEPREKGEGATKKKQTRPNASIRSVPVAPVISKSAKTKALKTMKMPDKDKEASLRNKEKLSTIEHDCKVWIGGLPNAEGKLSWKEVAEHFKSVGRPFVTDLRKKGIACMAFKTADAASTAIETLNGSTFKGSVIEVDAWTKPDRPNKKE